MAMGGNFASGDNALQTLSLLADPTKLAERIQTLSEAEARAREIVNLAGPASDIIQLREEAIKDRAAAKAELHNAQKALESARLEADNLKMQAISQRDLMIRGAENRAAEIHQQIQTKQDETNQWIMSIDTSARQLADRIEQHRQAEEELKARIESQKKSQAELDEAHARLARAQETIRQLTEV